MEDILKFLLIAGILIIGFVKQAKKEAKIPRLLQGMITTCHTLTKLIHFQKVGKVFQSLLPYKRTTLRQKSKHTSKGKTFYPPNYQTQQTVQHKQSVAQTPQTNRAETQDTSPAIDIQSAEEIRKGIIWSEILQRKY